MTGGNDSIFPRFSDYANTAIYPSHRLVRPASISGYVEPASGGETIDEDFDGLLAKATGDLDSVVQ